MAEEVEKKRVETLILQNINTKKTIEDTWTFSIDHKLVHEVVVGVMKSLLVDAYIASEEISTSFYVLKEEAKGFLTNGSPEVQVFQSIPKEGIERQALEKMVGPNVLKVGQGACMKNKWIRLDKSDGKFYTNVMLNFQTQTPYNEYY
jgi:phenylalanyl-tRNA synthetase alpha chain